MTPRGPSWAGRLQTRRNKYRIRLFIIPVLVIGVMRTCTRVNPSAMGGADKVGRLARGTREPTVSTSTATPPAWLEAAAKLDALLGDKSPPPAAKAQPADVDDTETPGDDREGEALTEPS